MSYPPLPQKASSRFSSVPASDLPPPVETSPRLAASSLNPAQKYLQNREKKFFDSADYFSKPLEERKETPPMNGNAFEVVEQEASRLGPREPRSSTLSFEMFNEIEGGLGDDVNSDDESKVARKPAHSMRKSSMEEFFVEENEHETVKHAILENPRLKRWDSGEFYSSPTEYRKMLATQAKEVWKQALEHAEEEHRPRRYRRSSLSLSETVSEDRDGEGEKKKNIG